MKFSSRASRVCILVAAAALLLLTAITGFAEDPAVAPAAIRTPPQGLWVTNFSFISDYQGLKLRRTGTSFPSFGFKSTGLYSNPAGMAFDCHKNLWFTYWFAGAVLELTPSQLVALAQGARVKPNVVLSTGGPATSSPYGIAFDSAGDLWVGDWELDRLSKFTPDQLKTSGTPVPAITITSDVPWSLARLRFDKAGNLWLVGNRGIFDRTISKLTPAQLAGGGALTPSLTIETVGNTLMGDLEFDSMGNMWVAVNDIFKHSDVLGLVDAADLNATGDIPLAPAITISPASIGSTDFSIQCPSGLAFDDRGNLWLANACSSYWGDIVEFTPDDLAVDGSPLPKVVLYSNQHGTNLNPTSILFGPLAP